jgi:hypothetical protein
MIRSESSFCIAIRRGEAKVRVAVMLIHPDRLLPAEPSTRKIAKTLYEHVRTLPIGMGGMAGSVGSALFAFFAGHALQLTQSYKSFFSIAAGACLLALIILCVLAPGLRKVELTA